MCQTVAVVGATLVNVIGGAVTGLQREAVEALDVVAHQPRQLLLEARRRGGEGVRHRDAAAPLGRRWLSAARAENAEAEDHSPPGLLLSCHSPAPRKSSSVPPPSTQRFPSCCGVVVVVAAVRPPLPAAGPRAAAAAPAAAAPAPARRCPNGPPSPPARPPLRSCLSWSCLRGDRMRARVVEGRVGAPAAALTPPRCCCCCEGRIEVAGRSVEQAAEEASARGGAQGALSTNSLGLLSMPFHHRGVASSCLGERAAPGAGRSGQRAIARRCSFMASISAGVRRWWFPLANVEKRLAFTFPGGFQALCDSKGYGSSSSVATVAASLSVLRADFRKAGRRRGLFVFALRQTNVG